MFPPPDLRSLPCFLLLCLAALLSACHADELREDMAREPFFDLADFVDRQVDSLTRLGTPVTKTVTLNGTTETRTLDDLNFRNDLRVFRAADINRPAWLDKYTTERREREGERITHYTATDSSLQTRQMSVYRNGSGVSRIAIERRTGTVLSDGIHHLDYRPATGYRVTTRQVNSFGADVDAVIEVRW